MPRRIELKMNISATTYRQNGYHKWKSARNCHVICFDSIEKDEMQLHANQFDLGRTGFSPDQLADVRVRPTPQNHKPTRIHSPRPKPGAMPGTAHRVVKNDRTSSIKGLAY